MPDTVLNAFHSCAHLYSIVQGRCLYPYFSDGDAEAQDHATSPCRSRGVNEGLSPVPVIFLETQRALAFSFNSPSFTCQMCKKY